ncbi:IclR family transcriptional regulator C-terminal domain-containing protein [Pseudonocardia halophobica]|uniref:Glycerol operon regulatory protein n=1 Tax=Pseudonocardia halophobica TaxID=29401 RepID=A0A9W6NVN5_9PSEU|nr:IclR family transcriptional regulator C-terminal domain-containing protein [Pseudonocardia halophobica]GLL10736.1 IclR family transcriptional regulator [Pseudonocardia halophobica]
MNAPEKHGANQTDHAVRAEHVQSLARGLSVIKAFNGAHPAQTLSDVARATGLTRAAARRFLLTLVELGYVRTDGRFFALTPRVLELGYSYLSALSLPELASPHLEELVETVHESASVSVLDGGDVVYVARVATARIMAVSITVGTRFPAYATSMGRVLLAALPPAELDARLGALEPLTDRTVADRDTLRDVLGDVRAAGYCLVDQELEDGLRSVAVPIRDAAGTVVAAANVSTHALRNSTAWLRDEALPHLRACAAAVEADLKGLRG